MKTDHERPRGMHINQPQWDAFREHWAKLREPVRKRWSQLDENDVERIDGDREALLDALQSAYGLRREEAEAQLRAFEEENEDYARAVQKTSAGTAFTPRF